jgi:hypothetical protein
VKPAQYAVAAICPAGVLRCAIASDTRILEHFHRPLVQDMDVGQIRGLRARARSCAMPVAR